MRKLSFIWMIVLFFAFGTKAEPLDPVFDSILVEAQEAAGDDDAYRKELIKAYGGEENKQFQNRWLIIVLSLMIALLPTCVILARVIKGELKPADTAAVWRTVGLLLFYGIVLFALNYIWLWTMITGETKIMGIVLGLCLLAFVIFAIYTLRKSKRN